MMTAEKGNKVYSIDESMKARYLNDGFDIYEDGKLLEYGKGKTVSYAEYEALQKENAALKAQVQELLSAKIQEAKNGKDAKKAGE
jgi:hypothetical protein